MKRILLVDDEEDVVLTIQGVLEGFDYDIFSTTKSLEALSEFKKEPDKYHIIIIDLYMPEMTGLILAKEIKNIKSTIPIILLSGDLDNINPKEITSAGIDKVVSKPFRIEPLIKAIEELVN